MDSERFENFAIYEGDLSGKTPEQIDTELQRFYGQQILSDWLNYASQEHKNIFETIINKQDKENLLIGGFDTMREEFRAVMIPARYANDVGIVCTMIDKFNSMVFMQILYNPQWEDDAGLYQQYHIENYERNSMEPATMAIMTHRLNLEIK